MAYALFRWTTFFLFSALLAAPRPASAVEPACQMGSMRVALDTFGSFYFLQPNKSIAGIDVDLFNELGRRIHCSPQIQTESVVRLIRRVELGEIDASAHKYFTSERARIAWLVPYLKQHHIVLIRKDTITQQSPTGLLAKDTPTQGPKSLLADDRIVLGIGKSWRYGKACYDDFVKQMRDKGRVVETADIDQQVALLRANRIQMLITSTAVYRQILTEDELTQFHIEEWDNNSPDPTLLLMLSRATVNKALYDRIAKTLSDMQQDGTLRRIVEKYVTPEEAQRMLAL